MTKSLAQGTRHQIAEATLEAVRTEGFAGATSRTIARIGGFNQALIYYHYGSVDGALLAALDLTSEARLARYRKAVDGAETPDALVRAARRLFREDTRSGHVSVVSQIVAGSLSRPELAGAVLERIEPWVELCEAAIRKLVPDPSAAEALPVAELAHGLVAFYLGANLLTHLDGAGKTDALLRRLEPLAVLLARQL